MTSSNSYSILINFRHGIIRMEYHILNDQELSFQDIMKRHLSGEKMVDKKEKRLYEEMRANAAAARKDKDTVKDEKEESKEETEPKEKDDADDDKKDIAKNKDETKTKEKVDASETKDGDDKDNDEESKEQKDSKEKIEKLETDEKESEKVEAEEGTTDEPAKDDVNKEDDEDENLKKTKLKGKLKKGKKRGPGRPSKSQDKDNPFVEDDLDDMESMDYDDIEDEDSKPASEKPAKKKPGRPPGRPKKQVEPSDEIEGKRSTRSDLKVIPFDGSPSKGSVSLTPVKKSSEQLESSQRRKGAHVNVSIDPPQISLQQMEQMARGGVYDMDMMTDLMQQTYAAAIKWPKDQILVIRLEHIMEAVETDKWPVSKDFSYAEAAQLTVPESPAAVEGTTSVRDTPTPAMSEVSELSNPYEDSNILTPGRKHGNRGRKPLGASASLHSPDLNDKSSKIRSLLTAGHQSRHNQSERDEEIR